MMNDKLIELPDYGRLIVVTDLHGNLEDYNDYLDLWDESDPDFHIVFCGDLIHGLDEDTDGSVEILDDAIAKSKVYSNFHTLLGNHEWAHITNTEIYKKFLWNRYNRVTDYTKGDVDRFLDVVGSKVMIVGHCPVESYKVFGKQIIMSSSFATKVKTYLDIDLSMEINDIKDVQKQLKFKI